MKSLSFSMRDLICGLFFIAVGLFFAIQAYGLDIGTAFKMGPGYFPLVLAGLLVIFGIIVIIQGTQSAMPGGKVAPKPGKIAPPVAEPAAGARQQTSAGVAAEATLAN